MSTARSRGSSPAAAADATGDAAPTGDGRLDVQERPDGASAALYIAPDGTQARLHERDCLYGRRVANERQGERFIEYRRRKVLGFVDVGGEWYVEWADDYDLGRSRVPLREVVATMAAGRPLAGDAGLDGGCWQQTSPEGFDHHDESGTWRTWEPVQPWERTPAVDLAFEQITGTGAQTTVNAFLEGETAAVDHRLGGINSWKAGFVARDAAGEIVSAAVTHHYHPSQNGRELCLTRLAHRADAPDNTSSWMLANVRQWARLEDYETLATYAGVDRNDGVAYRAAGFEPEGEPEVVEGATWSNSPGTDDVGTWRRQKYVVDLGGGRDG